MQYVYYYPYQWHAGAWGQPYPPLHPLSLVGAHPQVMHGAMQALGYMHQRMEQPLRQQIMNPQTRDIAMKHLQAGVDLYEVAHRNLQALLANPTTPPTLRAGANSMLTWVGEWRDRFREWLAIDTIHKLKVA